MASSDIVVSPVAGKADLKAFIDLPKRLYAGHKGYTPHLDVERLDAFSPKKNPLFGHALHILDTDKTVAGNAGGIDR